MFSSRSVQGDDLFEKSGCGSSVNTKARHVADVVWVLEDTTIVLRLRPRWWLPEQNCRGLLRCKLYRRCGLRRAGIVAITPERLWRGNYAGSCIFWNEQ